MLKLATATLVAGAALLASPASAQESDSWTGFYIGGQLGYGFQPNDDGETVQFDTNLDGTFGDTVKNAAGADIFARGFCGGAASGAVPADGCVGDQDGIEGGVHAGFDYQVGNSGLVVGLVGDYTRTRLRDSVSAYGESPEARYTLTRRIKGIWTIRARAGFAAGDTLFYGTAGLAQAKVRNNFTSSNTTNRFAGNGDESGWGYAFGGGIEHRISRHLSLGAQYLYRSVDAGDYVVRAAGATSASPFRLVNSNGTDITRSGNNFTSHALQATATFRF